MGFVASCVEDVANRLGVDYAEIYKRMDAVGMIDQYLIPFTTRSTRKAVKT